MSAVTFILTNAVGLWLPASDGIYAARTKTQLQSGTASTTLSAQFTAPDGTVLQTCTVQDAQIASNVLPLPCTMTITLMDVGGPASAPTGVVIAAQEFAYGGPGAAAGALFYPSPLFQAITTTIGQPSLSVTPTMTVTCTGAGYFALPAPMPAWHTAAQKGTAFTVVFSLAGTWAPDKQFTVAVDLSGGAFTVITNQTAPFAGNFFVLSAGTPTYPLCLSAYSLTVPAGTDAKFTLSSDVCYKSTFFMMSEQFGSAPIVDDTGAICGLLDFASNCTTATGCGAFKVTLTGNWQAPTS